MSWLHIPPALSCGNETAFDEAKPTFEIAQLGCACGRGSGACTENYYSWMENERPFLGAQRDFSFLTFTLPHEDRKPLLCRINACWSLSWRTAQSGKVVLAGEGSWPAGSPRSSRHLLNGPLKITPCHISNEESTCTRTAAHIGMLEGSPALTLLPGGTCLLHGCRLGEKREEPWHHAVHMELCAWLSLSSPDLRLSHRMAAGIINSRKMVCCWTATIARVS